MRSWIDIIAGLFVLSLVVSDVFGAARVESLTIGYSNFTGTYAPLWIAVKEHVGAKHGFDLRALVQDLQIVQVVQPVRTT